MPHHLKKIKEKFDKKVDKYFRRRKSKGPVFVAVKHSTFGHILYSSTLLTTAQGAETTDLTVQSSSIQAQSASSITTREPDQKSSTNIPDQPETNAMSQNTQDTTAEDTTAQNITSTLDALHQ